MMWPVTLRKLGEQENVGWAGREERWSLNGAEGSSCYLYDSTHAVKVSPEKVGRLLQNHISPGNAKMGK